MSSNFCSRPIDWSKYGLVYAGAQKNLGPAGVCVVVVRDDLIGNEMEFTPEVMNYKKHADAPGQCYNTPCCWAIYMAGLNIEHMLNKGLENIQKEAELKSNLIYDFIEASGGYYTSPIDAAFRSRMNVPFRVKKDDDLEKKFIAGAAAEGLIELKGHRSVGGIRASIYNAMPVEGVEKLVDFMKKFQEENP